MIDMGNTKYNNDDLILLFLMNRMPPQRVRKSSEARLQKFESWSSVTVFVVINQILMRNSVIRTFVAASHSTLRILYSQDLSSMVIFVVIAQKSCSGHN